MRAMAKRLRSLRFRLSLLCVGAVASAVATGCSRSTPASELPQSPPTIEVTMRENSFDYDGPVPEGRVVFRVRNAGRVDHRLTLMPLPEDTPPILEQITGPERRVGARFAGIPTRPPGTTGMFAVDLLPGTRYAMVCYVVDRDGTSHAHKGMVSEFRTSGPAEPPEPEGLGTTTKVPSASSTDPPPEAGG